MSRSNTFVSTVVFAVVVAVVAMSGSNQQRVDAFAPGPVAQRTHHGAGVVNSQIVNVKTLKMAFFNDEEPKKLTRESEPEEFFSTYVLLRCGRPLFYFILSPWPLLLQ
mmetsp:Transcript_16415/g.40049  ORF Transcript_16415/g.40049 Transcript_16415/m.40049 type:complete len:108 (+) Transcript_16415:161-484(+)